MKLQCQVEVVNRKHFSLDVRPKNKYLKSTLALGKEPKDDKGYFILHFSTVNKQGTKYRVSDMKNVFVKFLNEGKVTLRFTEPCHDLCIRSEVIQLKSFMRLLQSCITGDSANVKLSELSSLGLVSKDMAPTKLTINNRSEFPAKGLPRTLESLYIVGLNLCNFRRDILLLNHLAILDLSKNEIEKIPPEFGRLPNLCELYLSNNSLGQKEDFDWRWLLGPGISKKLKLLDLCANKISMLPKDIWKLQNLVTFKIDFNKLERLPPTIGRIQTLRYFSVSNNNLVTLPCSLMQCRLETIDLSSNKFNSDTVGAKMANYTPWELCAHTLVHIAAKAVLRNKLYYAPNIVPYTLVELMDNANMCVCGKPVLNNARFIIKEFQLKDFFRVVVFDNNGDSSVGFECFFCSPKCYAR
ncbi:leucine-rich repeat protein 1 [Danaus plexippus]|uniref:PIF1/LRR1 pleckstrin homology domain-containing protein n=1 Tax=Danaus plexippus plexippus TaxID=278856 RepID=A0A212EWM4_DANPL|nr:leucine-rich repeat protein 1 [Danaus plexippus]OWR45892.1 hypothetical protein KGM_204584 [Danaus plexippus plexippus]